MAESSGQSSSQDDLAADNGDENGANLDGTCSDGDAIYGVRGGGDASGGARDNGLVSGGATYGVLPSPVIVIDSPQRTDLITSGYGRSNEGGSDFEDIFSCSSGGGPKGHKKADTAEEADMASDRLAIKARTGQPRASAATRAIARGCVAAESNLATMERVNSSSLRYAARRSRSPIASSDSEDNHHSDPDADHSDSSDDDNPTSQVDRMIERGARMIMDGENSALSSETDDSSDDDGRTNDSDSDITDVSPLVSTSASPLGLSPVMSRRNVLSGVAQRGPFLRPYSQGNDGDVEDEGEEGKCHEDPYAPNYNAEDFDAAEYDDAIAYNDANVGYDANSPKMSYVVQKLLKLHLAENGEAPQERPSGPKLSPSLSANPHHRHLKKGRRRNLSFSSSEARAINSTNSILLEKLLAVDGRAPPPQHGAVGRRPPPPNRRDNLALLKRLNEVRPARHHPASHHNSHHKPSHNSNHNSDHSSHHTSHHNSHPSSHHNSHHSHHNSHHSSHHTQQSSHHDNPSSTSPTAEHHHRTQHHRPHHRSCGATARHPASSFTASHHSPKETAL